MTIDTSHYFGIVTDDFTVDNAIGAHYNFAFASDVSFNISVYSYVVISRYRADNFCAGSYYIVS